MIPTINKTNRYTDSNDNYVINELVAEKHAVDYAIIDNGKTANITTLVSGDVDCLDSDLTMIQSSVPVGWTVSDLITSGCIYSKVKSDSATWISVSPTDTTINRIVGSGYALTPSENLSLPDVQGKRIYLYKPCTINGVLYPEHTVILFDATNSIDIVNEGENNILILFEVLAPLTGYVVVE